MPQALISDEMCIRQDECVMLFQGALHEERDRSLRGVKAPVGIDAAGFHQVIDDSRRIGNTHTGVLDERQLALRAFARIGVSTTS